MAQTALKYDTAVADNGRVESYQKYTARFNRKKSVK